MVKQYYSSKVNEPRGKARGANAVFGLFGSAAVGDLSTVTRDSLLHERPMIGVDLSVYVVLTPAPDVLAIRRRSLAHEPAARERRPTNRDHASRVVTSPFPFLPIT